MKPIAWVNEDNISLLLDFYELTMLQAYWSEKMRDRAVFSLFFRNLPEERNFILACGQDEVLQLIRALRFDEEAVERLSQFRQFSPGFLEYLRSFRFTGDIYAVPEGTPVFPQEPILEVEAPIGEAQIIESLIMNQVHLQSVLASAAIRLKLAAGKFSVVDFGFRRMHGIDAGVKGVRAFYIAGLDATSNVLAGVHYGMPVQGTMGHSYLQAHDTEIEAFEAFTDLYSDATLLVDTYDSIRGVQRAIELFRRFKSRFRFSAIRLDSGDLLELSGLARRLLNESGLRHVKIFVSGGLDEYKIQELVERGAPIDGFGVGTYLAVSYNAPALDLAYKLTEYQEVGRFKNSPGKEILPGPKQIYRLAEGEESMHDRLTARNEPSTGRPLLKQVMRNGKILDESLSDLNRARQYAQCEVDLLPEEVRSLNKLSDKPGNAGPYRVVISNALQESLAAARKHWL